MSESDREELVLHLGCLLVGMLAAGPSIASDQPLETGATLGLLLAIGGFLGLCAQLRGFVGLPQARTAKRERSR